MILRVPVEYQRSLREGPSIVEVSRPDAKAVEEERALYGEIYRDESKKAATV